MNLQLRVVTTMLLLGAIGIATGSVLLLVYVFAGFSLTAILFIMGRKTIKGIGDARLSRPRLLPRWPIPTSRAKDENPSLAA